MIENFEDNYEVCNCKKVTLGDIKKLYHEGLVKTLGDLQELTFSGTECRKCLMKEGDFGKIKKKIYCMDILKELKNV